MSGDPDACVPKVVIDFVFDLYDSVTLSQLAEEQSKLYETDSRDLHAKYFASQPWPSPQAIASECNGHPLFLAVYRELTHRYWTAVSRPTIRDRMEGWQVYRELFEEILETENFYLLPSWCFDILHEFVYQYQGYCQVRSAVFASARKHGLLRDETADGEGGAAAASGGSGPSTTLMENLALMQNNADAWDAELVFGYLHKFIKMGMPEGDRQVSPAYTYLATFSSVALSRLECLLGDYTACLQALTPIVVHDQYVIPKEDAKATVRDVLNSVAGAKISLAYHAGVSFLMLRRYRDALKALGDICAYLQRVFKTGQLRKLPDFEQYNKQYDRMLSLMAVLVHICPSANQVLEDSVRKAVREKYGTRVEAASTSGSSTYEEFFASPKFISASPMHPGQFHRQQVQCFVHEMKPQRAFRELQSYLKLYTSIPVSKLASFYDQSSPEFLPLLLSYKARTRQIERDDDDTYIGGTYKTALDIHFYLVGDNCHVDEPEKQRRFETYFASQILQNSEIQKDAVAIDTKV